MFHDLETLIGSSAIAKDGEMGSVHSFLFDDQSWKIRYLTVDVGSWLARRAVVLAITAVEQPDWATKTLHINLTKEQVRNSPDVDSEKPVSRQQEVAMREYYGWPIEWLDHELGGPVPPGREFPVHARSNPHLRSAWHVDGYEVWSADVEVGRVEGFVMDDTSWHISYLDVKAGDWLHSRSVLVPTGSVKSISWGERRIYLRHAHDKPDIKRARRST